MMFMVTIIVSQSFYDVNWGFSTGLNENGVLGLGNQLNTYYPTRIPKMINISRVSVDKHALILLQNGSVFSHGAGQPEGGVSPGNWAIGTWGSKSHGTPRLIQGLVGIEIVQVSAGYSHSIVLSSQNEIYSFGTNNV
jgi:alpha-tubulin suppressor-like RCC1 family protein